ncbi:MAG: ribonuclease HII [Candidatus Omnitrophica bacterium CG08_land_8_20_14_0_20_41_16]|uniref:Ribonuclease HII n=1 Tax=Candidatus Sherwoodlollariibacterium unditelluris TaxID=1974757 RepID=A0A2G9YKK7_9BACT|nr:MAG: ribonuclease HII [Candidatus Omnitrophica bacterium CG23_combo_of_CG06-09_8_20_14_all_41_10]PIS33722.1 MAG: ribonuclease HII [Candidatus Omnitrophica bacterium CG08_land_8_20_14_0_20_41_16]
MSVLAAQVFHSFKEPSQGVSFYYENKLKKKGFDFIIGVDEAGRGPLAGPVVSAAVLLKKEKFNSRIDDSKKLTSLGREKAFLEIIKNSIFGISIVSEKTIDRVNILEATRLSMRQAVNSLIRKLHPSLKGIGRCIPVGLGAPKVKGIHVIVDGNMVLDLTLPYTAIIKGDTKSKTIAAASILAKVTRDRLMLKYDKIYPEYGFAKHKGYPTKEHRDILKKIGPSRIHRKSFKGV